jgi:Tfp pilus assembly protein PilV
VKKERKKERSSGISLIEVLLAFLLLIIIVTGVSFGIIQLNQRIKQLELHRTARELIERIKSELSTYSYSNFSSL